MPLLIINDTHSREQNINILIAHDLFNVDLIGIELIIIVNMLIIFVKNDFFLKILIKLLKY